MTTVLTSVPFVVRPGEGQRAPMGSVGTVCKISGAATDGRLAIVEHALRPRYLAAPVHRHSREDEISIVLSGVLGAKLGDDVVIAGVGSYVLKSRGQWHTYWNAGNTPLRFVELLLPAGVEGYFEQLSRLFASDIAPSHDDVEILADEYGLQFDFQSVPALCRQFGLRF